MRDTKIVNYMEIPLDIKASESKKICFIVYSSRESHIDITLDAIETVLESTKKYEIKRLAIHGMSGLSQYAQLLRFLNKCSLAIIILDGFRPNVIFEYGILVGLGKPCIVLLEQNATVDIKSFIKSEIKKPPVAIIDMDKDFSDVKDQMYVKYKYSDPKNLRKILGNELNKIAPLVEETFMKLVFPEKNYIEKEVKASLEVFSEISNSDEKLTADQEIKFRVCVNEIEKTANKYGIKLTYYYYHQKIQIISNLGKYEEAIKMIDDLMIDYSSDAQHLLFSKCNILKMQGEYELAVKCLNDAIKIDGENESFWHNKGLLLERLDKREEAFFCYKKGVELKHDCSGIHYHYGILLADHEKYNEALIQFSKAIKLRPSDPDYHVWKAICLVHLDKKIAAKEAIADALSFDENNASAWYQLGRITDDKTNKLKYFDKCLSLNNTHSGALCSRGSLLSNTGRAEEALVNFKQAMATCIPFTRNECKNIHGKIGKTKYRLYLTGKEEFKGYLLEARDHFIKAINPDANDNDNKQAFNDIGYISLLLSQIPEAKAYLTKADKLHQPSKKDEALTSYNLGLCYLMERDYIQAKKLLTKTISLSSKIKTSEREFMCLLLPELKEANINLVEVITQPDLLKFAKVALSITGGFKA